MQHGQILEQERFISEVALQGHDVEPMNGRIMQTKLDSILYEHPVYVRQDKSDELAIQLTKDIMRKLLSMFRQG